tara:strand:- start:24377 stop:24736 length:360 start_codon:yes stop_codon:yes gene_type:complete
MKKLLWMLLVGRLPDFGKRIIYFGALYKQLCNSEDKHALQCSLDKINQELKLSQVNPRLLEMGYYLCDILFPDVKSVDNLDNMSDVEYLRTHTPDWIRFGNSQDMKESIDTFKNVLVAH